MKEIKKEALQYMNFLEKNGKGILLCLALSIPSWFLGKQFPIIGGAVIAIIAGMVITLFLKNKTPFESGVKFTSKKVLQWAVILLGFGMNLTVIVQTGKQSLPIIISTIATSLVIAYLLHRLMHIPGKISTLVGVGSSICGGSATLDTAVTVKLTRTLAIIPITLVLAMLRTRKEKQNGASGQKVSLKQIFPFFILYFIAASVITTVAVSAGIDAGVFTPVKELSKFFIVLAMSAIGLNTDIVKLVKTGGKPIVMGFCCWTGITGVSLLMQHLMGLW